MKWTELESAKKEATELLRQAKTQLLASANIWEQENPPPLRHRPSSFAQLYELASRNLEFCNHILAACPSLGQLLKPMYPKISITRPPFLNFPGLHDDWRYVLTTEGVCLHSARRIYTTFPFKSEQLHEETETPSGRKRLLKFALLSEADILAIIFKSIK